MEAVNIFSAENAEGRVDVARAVGSTATVMFIYDLPPGGASSPYHYEYEEEWLLVVDGTVVVRARRGAHPEPRRPRLLPARSRRSAQADEPLDGAGEDADVLELSGTGCLRLSGQRQDRRLARQRVR